MIPAHAHQARERDGFKRVRRAPSACADGHLDASGRVNHLAAQRGATLLLQRARDEPDMLRGLIERCDARVPLFEPQRERATLTQLMSDLLGRKPARATPTDSCA